MNIKKLANPGRTAFAEFPFRMSFLPLVIGFVENSSNAFGFGARESGSLVLAAEELYSYYCPRAGNDSVIDVRIDNEAYRLVLVISFNMTNPDMRAFNLTFNVDPENEESLDMLGPMIAARSVSSLKIDLGQNDRLIITAARNRDYPDQVPVFPPGAVMPFTTKTGKPSLPDMQHFSSLVSGSFSGLAPSFLLCSGMASDMLASGAISAVFVYGGDTILGGIVWAELTDTCVEIFGPYVFCGETGGSVASALLDHCMGEISRTRIRSILRRQDRLDDHERYFDYLGNTETVTNKGETREHPHYYRQLREETSSAVYCDRKFGFFLKSHYDRLCLPRQVREIDFQTHNLRENSVISVEFDRGHSSAILRPMCAGLDMAANISAHLELLGRENILNIFAETDTGKTEEMIFTSALMESGFKPRLIIPEAGAGDIVIFSYTGPGSRHES